MYVTGEMYTRTVTVNGRILSVRPSQRLFNHSPNGFNWGYEGSGPAQLALALLLRAGLSEKDAVRWHQQFKREVIAKLEPRDFEITIDVEAWWKAARANQL